MFAPAAAALHALLYVSPSQPQTGMNSSVQTSGITVHTPLVEIHAPISSLQYSPSAHSPLQGNAEIIRSQPIIGMLQDNTAMTPTIVRFRFNNMIILPREAIAASLESILTRNNCPLPPARLNIVCTGFAVAYTRSNGDSHHHCDSWSVRSFGALNMGDPKMGDPHRVCRSAGRP